MIRLGFLILLLSPSIANAMCMPEDCELLELKVEQCVSASGALEAATMTYNLKTPSGGREIDEAMLNDLKGTNSLALYASVIKRRALSPEACAGGAETSNASSWVDGEKSAAADFIYYGKYKSCDELPKASFYALKLKPCCDTIPASSPECLLSSSMFLQDAAGSLLGHK